MSPRAAARQASLPITNSQRWLTFMCIQSEMSSNHLILCRPLLLPPSIFSSIRVFPNESALHVRWPNTGVSASELVLPMNIQDLFPLRLTDLISLLSKGISRVFSNTRVQKHQFFLAQSSLWSNSPSIHDHWKNHSFDYTDFCQQCNSHLRVYTKS